MTDGLSNVLTVTKAERSMYMRFPTPLCLMKVTLMEIYVPAAGKDAAETGRHVR